MLNRNICGFVTGLAMLLPLLSACSQDPAIRGVADIPARADGASGQYVIGGGDQISVHLTFNPSFDQVVEVQPDGRIALPMVGTLQAAGRTMDGLSQQIASQYGQYLQRPDVILTLKNDGSQRILVGGEVARAGSIPLEPGATIADAITAAGGLKDSAADQILLFRRDGSGESHVYRIDVASVSSGKDLSQDVPLQARDRVFVPRSGLAEVNLFMKHVFRDNLPINVGGGFGL
jgi:protein involved in polysaccharide export with SLBB domain